MKQIKCDDCPCLDEGRLDFNCRLGYGVMQERAGDDYMILSDDCKLVGIFTEGGENDYKPIILGEIHNANTET